MRFLVLVAVLVFMIPSSNAQAGLWDFLFPQVALGEALMTSVVQERINQRMRDRLQQQTQAAAASPTVQPCEVESCRHSFRRYCDFFSTHQFGTLEAKKEAFGRFLQAIRVHSEFVADLNEFFDNEENMEKKSVFAAALLTLDENDGRARAFLRDELQMTDSEVATFVSSLRSS